MIKCCGKTPTIRMYYRYNISNIKCHECDKMWDVHIPDYIPYDQYNKYVTKKYNEIIIKEEILLTIIECKKPLRQKIKNG